MRYRIGEFAKKLGVHVETLRRWDKKGILSSQRSIGGNRYYTDEDFQKYKKAKELLGDEASAQDTDIPE